MKIETAVKGALEGPVSQNRPFIAGKEGLQGTSRATYGARRNGRTQEAVPDEGRRLGRQPESASELAHMMAEQKDLRVLDPLHKAQSCMRRHWLVLTNNRPSSGTPKASHCCQRGQQTLSAEEEEGPDAVVYNPKP